MRVETSLRSLEVGPSSPCRGSVRPPAEDFRSLSISGARAPSQLRSRERQLWVENEKTWKLFVVRGRHQVQEDETERQLRGVLAESELFLGGPGNG